MEPTWGAGAAASHSSMADLPPPSFPPPQAPPSSTRPRPVPPPPPHPTFPVVAAVGAILVLTGSLVASKYLLDAIVGFGWPVVVYVVILAAVGYGPPLWWCRHASRRWGSGRLGADIGLTPRWSDLGWGPLIWLGAIGAQLAVAAVVLGLGIPITNNTEGISELSADRTYIVSIVITAVVAAPIVEEMVFRGVVMRGLRSRLPAAPTIIFQGILFGVAHVDPVRGAGNIGLVMVLSGVGVAFGVAVYLLRRIGPAIVAHAIFNAVILVLVLSGVADRLEEMGQNAAEPASAVEQIAIVDEPDLAQAYGAEDSCRARWAIVG
jgi:uncharacterized protein